MKIVGLITVIALLFAGSLEAQQATTLLPSDSAVITGKLPNGLTYYIRRNTEPANRAILYLVTRVGSLMEDDNQLGLAHFTEHMAFNGTRDFPKNELIDYLQKAGVKFGADVNASTSFNETIYKLPLPTDSAEVFKKSFNILANWAGLVSFDPDAIDRERGIILEEERSRGKNLAERIQKQIFPALLNYSRYASRLPMGTDEILRNFKPETIKQFYHDWYRPDLQAVIAVGDFDPEEVESLIKQNFSSLKNPVNSRKRIEYSIPPSKGTEIKIITDPEQAGTKLQIIVRHQAKAVTTTSDLVQSLTRSLFNRMIGARVADLRRESGSPILTGSIGYGEFLADIDAFTIALTAKPGQLEQAVKKLLYVNEQVKQFGFTATELERAKKSLLNTIEKKWKERDKNSSANFVNEYLVHFIKGDAFPGIDYEYAFIKNNIGQISLQHLHKLATTFNKKDNRVIIIEAPEKDKYLLPDGPALLSWINNRTKDVKAYSDDIVTTPLLEQKSEGSKITYFKKNAGTGVTELTLGNGVRVVLKPTSFKNDQVIINGLSYGGTSDAPDSVYTAASLSALLVNRSGLGNLSRAQIRKKLAGRSVNLSVSINEFTKGISGSSSPGELETAMQLIYLYFTQPQKDREVWSSIISEQQAGLAQRGASPIQVFQDTIAVVLKDYDRRKTGMDSTALASSSVDQAYRFYKDCFADADNFTFILVGNLDLEKVKPLIEEYLGALPVIKGNEVFKYNSTAIPVGNGKKVVYRGLEAKSRVQLIFSGNYLYNDRNNTRLEALKEIINYRLLQRLRAQESGVYTPSVSLSNARIPAEKYTISISFNCAPEKVDTLINASLEEIEKLKTDGPLASDIEKFVAGQQRIKETQLKSNVYWAYYLREQYLVKEKPDDKLRVNEYLKEITQQSIKSAAVRYVNGGNLMQFVLMPEKTE